MSLKAAEICATVGTILAVGGAVVALACCCDKDTKVVVEPAPNPKPVVRVVHTTPSAPAPIPGVPAYKIPMGQPGQPYVISSSSSPMAVHLPHGYKHGYVVYRGANYTIHTHNGNHYYVYNGVHYPVYYC